MGLEEELERGTWKGKGDKREDLMGFFPCFYTSSLTFLVGYTYV
jgi:hypothetical protein